VHRAGRPGRGDGPAAARQETCTHKYPREGFDSTMGLVSDILETKGHEVLDIDASATVLEAVTKMVDGNVGSLLVTDGGRLVGIVTERDYLRRVTLEGRDERTTPVGEIMSTAIVYTTPESSIDECMAVMTERRIRHLPVLDEGRNVVGVVSIGDVVKFQSKEQSVQIKFLTEYISG
jgi:CBS domain-containing protein